METGEYVSIESLRCLLCNIAAHSQYVIYARQEVTPISSTLGFHPMCGKGLNIQPQMWLRVGTPKPIPKGLPRLLVGSKAKSHWQKPRHLASRKGGNSLRSLTQLSSENAGHLARAALAMGHNWHRQAFGCLRCPASNRWVESLAACANSLDQ